MKDRNDNRKDSRQVGAKIPDKPRDCGPHVDTWPILDTQVGDAPKPKTDEYGNARRDASSTG